MLEIVIPAAIINLAWAACVYGFIVLTIIFAFYVAPSETILFIVLLIIVGIIFLIMAILGIIPSDLNMIHWSVR